MRLVRWLGFAFVTAALVALPIALWASAWWGFVAGGVGAAGLILLGIAAASGQGE